MFERATTFWRVTSADDEPAGPPAAERRDARAGQRAVDEGVPIQKAAGRPNLGAVGQYQEFVQQVQVNETLDLGAL